MCIEALRSLPSQISDGIQNNCSPKQLARLVGAVTLLALASWGTYYAASMNLSYAMFAGIQIAVWTGVKLGLDWMFGEGCFSPPNIHNSPFGQAMHKASGILYKDEQVEKWITQNIAPFSTLPDFEEYKDYYHLLSRTIAAPNPRIFLGFKDNQSITSDEIDEKGGQLKALVQLYTNEEFKPSFTLDVNTRKKLCDQLVKCIDGAVRHLEGT